MAATDTHSGERVFLGVPEIFACPACGSGLRCEDESRIACASGSHRFEIEAGLPLLYWPEDANGTLEQVTCMVRQFYERTPFPDYEDLDTPDQLREKAERGLFARLLDEQIPHGAKVLEVGCGTGQLSNFLGLTWGRRVFGTDISVSSLRLAQHFNTAHHIEQARFYQMNLFRPVFVPGCFDLAICNGVLHHTGDPRRGLAAIARLVRSGGLVVIGLYNRFGRISTDLRRWVFRVTRDHLQGLDPYLRRTDVSARKKRAWFADQYKHPHETKHTMGEALRWFHEAGLEYVNGIPKPILFGAVAQDERLFEPNRMGGALDRFLVQAGMMLGGGREGGFFLMIGRRP